MRAVVGLLVGMLTFGIGAASGLNCRPAVATVSSVAEIKEAPEHKGIVFEQFYLPCLSQASYLIGDTKTGKAIVVDPERDIDKYIESAQKHGLKITHVFLTHVHADFVAGHLELQRRTGAQICMGADAKAAFKFLPFKDGDKLAFDALAVRVLHTPGHTPEAISLTIADKQTGTDGTADGTAPYAVLTGDALFIGDVGRPDLLASSGYTDKQLAGMLYDSLRNKLMKLDDAVLLYPAHGAGSLCGKNMSSETVSTIGAQKKTNYALQPMDKEKFVALVTADQPPAPKYFSYDAKLNMSKHRTLDSVVAQKLKPINREQLLRLKNGGAQILDVREADDYAKVHLVDSLNIPLSGRFAGWAGAFLDRDVPIVLIAPPGKEKQAALRLGRVGFDNYSGFLSEAIDKFPLEEGTIVTAARTDAQQLDEAVKGKKPPVVLDIRTNTERGEAQIANSLFIPLIQMQTNIADVLQKQLADVPKDREIVVYCATGFRSSLGASLLRQQGFKNVSDLRGGITAWQKAGLPVQTGNCATAVKPALPPE